MTESKDSQTPTEAPPPPVPVPLGPPPILVETPERMAELVVELSREPAIAVDTESDSFHHYFEKVCLIQISTLARDYIIDPLAVGEGVRGLGPLFASPDMEKVFHDAGYDIICLKRDYGFEFRRLFDTMQSCRLLGLKRFGLGTLLQERFGIETDKRLQRSDWSVRPLSPAQLHYARHDTHFLLQLRDQLSDELRARGRFDLAQEEFARLCDRGFQAREFDDNGYMHIKGAKALPPRNLGVLRDLYKLRDARARQLDQPPFKVLADQAMLATAQRMPRDEASLLRISGFTRRVLSRLGGQVLQVVRTAEPETSKPRTVQPRRRAGRGLQPRARKIFDVLKQWRTDRAAEWGIDPDVLMSNATLNELAKSPPATEQELQAYPELSGWRLRALGPALLEVLKRAG